MDLKVDAKGTIRLINPDGSYNETTFDWPTPVDDPDVCHFDVGNLAPLDNGEITYSLHNDGSRGGVITSITVSPYTEGEGLNPEPETAMPPTGIGDTDLDAELDEQLHIMMWNETDGDNVYNATLGEMILLDGKVKDVLSNTTATECSIMNQLDAGQTKYVGFKWWVQDHGVLSNEIMGDWVQFDITFNMDQLKLTAPSFNVTEKWHAATVEKGVALPIIVNVENTGDIGGSVAVSVAYAGAASGTVGPVSVTIAGHANANVTLSWTPTVVGSYTLTATAGSSSKGPQPVEVTPRPVSLTSPPRFMTPVYLWDHRNLST